MVKIIVAAHKPYRMPQDSMYLPVQVGAAGKDSIGFQRDDEQRGYQRGRGQNQHGGHVHGRGSQHGIGPVVHFCDEHGCDGRGRCHSALTDGFQPDLSALYFLRQEFVCL